MENNLIRWHVRFTADGVAGNLDGCTIGNGLVVSPSNATPTTADSACKKKMMNIYILGNGKTVQTH